MQLFPSLAAREACLAETNFAARKTKNVFAWSQKHFCFPDTNFVSETYVCYGTDFATTVSVFSSFIWGLNFSTLPWPAANYFLLCRRWQPTPHSAVAGRQLSLVRRCWQTTLSFTLSKLAFKYVLAEI